MSRVPAPARQGSGSGGIVAGIFAVLAGIVALGFWWDLFTGGWMSVVVIGIVAVIVLVASHLSAKEAEGALVLRIEHVDDTPPPHPSRQPPEVSLYARGVVISATADSPAGRYRFRRHRVGQAALPQVAALCGLDPSSLGSGQPNAPATAVGPAPQRVVGDRRFIGARVADDDLPDVRRRLMDLSWLPAGSVTEEKLSLHRCAVRLVPVADPPTPLQEWMEEGEPDTFGHPLTGSPEIRCGLTSDLVKPLLAARASGRSRPYPAYVRGADGTVYRIEGRPLLPEEAGCYDIDSPDEDPPSR